jgi:hypothetical protein
MSGCIERNMLANLGVSGDLLHGRGILAIEEGDPVYKA